MKIYLVGGAVRDKLLGLPVNERDWVVVGASVEDMLKLGYKQVGKEFPVFLHPKTGEEYALARMERKVKPGYKGFTFDTSPDVTLEEDLIRRDLTINAMAETPDGKIEDPYHGKQDLEQKILRHVSPAFAEDPVRILRVGRFLARYAHMGFHVAPETIELMRNMVAAGEVDALVAERVWKELERALGEKNPEKFFEVLKQCGALPKLFPHLEKDSKGICALKSACKITPNSAVRFAALFHSTTKQNIAEISKRYRVPNAYHELAKLTALHYEKALSAQTLSADELLSLFSALDIYRRKERFHDFLFACAAIGIATESEQDDEYLKTRMGYLMNWLHNCAHAAKSADVQALIAQGLEGAALAEKLKEKRLEKITEFLHQQK